jgi:hypothetical protein
MMTTLASTGRPHPPRPAPDWQHRGSCRGTDTDMFFSADGERGHARARRQTDITTRSAEGNPARDTPHAR